MTEILLKEPKQKVRHFTMNRTFEKLVTTTTFLLAKSYILTSTSIYLIKMENETSTIRLYKNTIERMRKHKPTPGTSDDWVLNWLLDQVEEKKEHEK